MLLGLDLGTTHLKAGVYSRDGELLAHAQAPTPLETSHGLSHFPPKALWEAAAGLIRKVAVRTSVEALAVSSMGEAGATLDAGGEPTYPIIPWYDGRGARQMQRLADKVGEARFYEITGLCPNPIHTVAKWLWLRDHEPGAWRDTKLWLPVADYIAYRLSGEAAAEHSLAARTMAYDVAQGKWSEEILTSAGLDRAFLPPLVQAGSQIGGVTREASRLTGLAEETPVFAGGHDHICAAFACGAFVPGIVLASQGTAEGLTLGLPERPAPQRAQGFGVGPHVVKGHSYLLGGIYSSGGALAWVRELLSVESFAALQALAEACRPGEAPLFIAQFHGAAPPFNDAKATGAFIGLTPEHRQAHLARAVYEGIVFELRAGFEALERARGTPSEVVRMVGGSASDPFWPPLRATILGRPLELSRYGDMVTLGTALLAGLGLGIYRSPEEAVASTYRASRSFTPDARQREIYDDRYARYHRASRALRRFRTE
jgi:sugar (pentulose or hexulose) kinase